MSSFLTTYSDLLDDFLWPEEGPKQRSKRLRVLQAATEFFVRFGYQKASMDDIAHAARVSKGGLYLYFPNKNLVVTKSIYQAALNCDHQLGEKCVSLIWKTDFSYFRNNLFNLN